MSDEALHFEDLSTAEYLGDLSVYPPDEYRQKFLVIGDRAVREYEHRRNVERLEA